MPVERKLCQRVRGLGFAIRDNRLQCATLSLTPCARALGGDERRSFSTLAMWRFPTTWLCFRSSTNEISCVTLPKLKAHQRSLLLVAVRLLMIVGLSGPSVSAAPPVFCKPSGFFPPREPRDNAFIQSSNGEFRADCLNINGVLSVDDALLNFKRWRKDHNEVRPHSTIGNNPPLEWMNG